MPSNYPAAVSYVINIIMAAVISFHWLSATAAQDLAVAVVSATSLLVVFLVRPVTVAAATGAAQVFLVSLAAFGLHLSTDKIAAIVGVVGFVIAFVTHQLVIPAKAVQQGKTGNELELGTTGRAL